MAWTTPKTWTNTGVRRSEFNTHLRDNLLALKYPSSALYLIKETTDYSTSSTSFADINVTEGKFLHTITTYGNGNGGNGDVFVCLNAVLYSAAGAEVNFRILMDGVVQNADDGLLHFNVNAGALVPASFLIPIRDVSPGSHAFKLQWVVFVASTVVLLANAGTLTRDIKGQFWAREMS
jgi:hypothetical protein